MEYDYSPYEHFAGFDFLFFLDAAALHEHRSVLALNPDARDIVNKVAHFQLEVSAYITSPSMCTTNSILPQHLTEKEAISKVSDYYQARNPILRLGIHPKPILETIDLMRSGILFELQDSYYVIMCTLPMGPSPQKRAVMIGWLSAYAVGRYLKLEWAALPKRSLCDEEGVWGKSSVAGLSRGWICHSVTLQKLRSTCDAEALQFTTLLWGETLKTKLKPTQSKLSSTYATMFRDVAGRILKSEEALEQVAKKEAEEAIDEFLFFDDKAESVDNGLELQDVQAVRQNFKASTS